MLLKVAPSILVLLPGSPHLIASLREQKAQRVTHARCAHCSRCPAKILRTKATYRKEFIWAYGSRGRVQYGRSSMPAGGWSRKPKDHITARRKQ